MVLFKGLGVVAGFVLFMAALQILIVNTRLLPKELQPSLASRIGLIAAALFYAAMFAAVAATVLR
jgi:xanthine/uracil/vitamin C permease (AzgA family)